MFNLSFYPMFKRVASSIISMRGILDMSF